MQNTYTPRPWTIDSCSLRNFLLSVVPINCPPRRFAKGTLKGPSTSNSTSGILQESQDFYPRQVICRKNSMRCFVKLLLHTTLPPASSQFKYKALSSLPTASPFQNKDRPQASGRFLVEKTAGMPVQQATMRSMRPVLRDDSVLTQLARQGAAQGCPGGEWCCQPVQKITLAENFAIVQTL